MLTLIITTLMAKTQQDLIDFNLHRFSYIGDLSKVKQALKNGANLEKYDDKKMTPLLNAGFKNRVNVVKYLIDNGADINHKSHSGRNILTYAIQKHNRVLAKYLLDKNIEVVISDDNTDSLLSAIEYRELEIVKLLLPFYKNLDRDIFIKKDDRHWKTKTTYLLRAIQKDETNIAKFLIENNVDINKANSRGETPLLSAMRNKNYELADHLIAKGAKLDNIDISGNSALSYAIKAKKEDLALKIVQKNKNIDLKEFLTYGVAVDKNDAYEEYISKTDDNNLHYTYLHMASLHGLVEVAKHLIKKGLNIDTLSKDSLQLDALGLAVFKGQTKMAKYLIKNGANPYNVYKNIHPQGNRGLFYFAGGYKKYSLLALATISQKRDKKLIAYLLNLKDGKKYLSLIDDTFYFNLKVTLIDNKNEELELVLNRLKSWGYRNRYIDSRVDEIFEKFSKKDNKSKKNKPKTKDELLAKKINTAIESGDLKTLQKLKKDGVDINKTVPWALFNTTWEKHPELLLPLIDIGVDVKTKAYISKMSIYHRLIIEHSRYGVEDFANIFFTIHKHGLDINEITEEVTPLYDYLRNVKSYNKEFIEKALENNAIMGNKWWQLRDILEISHENLEYIFSHPKLKQMIAKTLQDKDIVKVYEKRYPKRLEKLFELAYRNNIPLDYKQFFYYLKDRDIEMARIAMYYMEY